MDSFSKVIEKSGKLIFNKIETEKCRTKKEVENNGLDYILPMEYYMKIPLRMRSHKFYQDLRVGDVVIGCVTRIHPNHIEANLICTSEAFVRDIESLKINVICRANELPIVSNFSSVNAFQCGDKIKAIIIKITRNESLEISMNELSPKNKLHQNDLGLISDDNLEPYYKICQDCSTKQHYFNYSFPINELSALMNIKNKLEYFNNGHGGFSLLNEINEIKIPENETGKNLRNAYILKESEKYVVKGVDYFKLKRFNEALQCFNHALRIYDANVDALVARGALRATSKAFLLSIEDLKRAVQIDPHHKNAALYLSQAIVAYSKSLPENDRNIAEDLVKSNILLKDPPRNKATVKDIKDPNQFIIISDEDFSDSSKSTKSRKKRKNKKSKRQKFKTSKKNTSTDSSSSEERKHCSKNLTVSIDSLNEDRKHRTKHVTISDDTSSDSDIHNKSKISSLNSKRRKRKHSNDLSRNKYSKSRHVSSSTESDDRLNQSKHDHDKSSLTRMSDHHISFLNSSASSSNKRKSKIDSSSEKSTELNNNKRHEINLPRYLNRSFRDDFKTQSWLINNDNNHNQTNHDKLTFSECPNQNSSVNQTIKSHFKNDDPNSVASDIVECDQKSLRLKKADENIKNIEDFMSSLKQNVA